jgi:hypothetical protein
MDKAIATISHADDGDGDAVFAFEPGAVTAYGVGQPASNGAEPNDRKA